MKKLKENKGFTLVELIVVIAILGILAAVAVPAYSGYVTKAKDASDLQSLSVINTAAQAAATSAQKTIGSIEVTASSGTISAIVVKDNGVGPGTICFFAGTDSASTLFKQLLGSDFLTKTKLEGTYAGGAEWKPATDSTSAAWSAK